MVGWASARQRQARKRLPFFLLTEPRLLLKRDREGAVPATQVHP
jgi:hypothetical protein